MKTMILVTMMTTIMNTGSVEISAVGLAMDVIRNMKASSFVGYEGRDITEIETENATIYIETIEEEMIDVEDDFL